MIHRLIKSNKDFVQTLRKKIYIRESGIRAKTVVDSFCEFLDPHSRVLSVGDGDGTVSAELMRRHPLTIQGVDVEITLPYRAQEIALDYYDGHTLPYKDGSFDVVCGIFVLHHCDDINRVLSEIIRVARKKIIIIEDVYRNAVGRKIVCLNDYIENRLFSPNVNIPFNFKNTSEWEDTFLSHGLTLQDIKPFNIAWWIPVRHQVFHLYKD